MINLASTLHQLSTKKGKQEMTDILNEIDAKVFGETFLKTLQKYGFGIPSKADIEAAMLDAFYKASKALSAGRHS